MSCPHCKTANLNENTAICAYCQGNMYEQPQAAQQFEAPVQPNCFIPQSTFTMPPLVAFFMKVTAFFVPFAGWILGCLVNLTPYDDRKELSHSLFKL